VTTFGEKLNEETFRVTSDFGYECSEILDATRLLCMPGLHNTIQPFGSVALATVNPAATTITMKQIAPSSEGSRTEILVAPDGETIAIHDTTGWYSTTVDNPATPVRQPLSQQKDLGDILFWH
jgi:hypothetical protein